LALKVGEAIFQVKKAILLENLGLFQENPSLLSAPEYEVQTQVPPEIFAVFVSIIEGNPITLSKDSCDFLGLLAQEFRFKTLSDACSEFMESYQRSDESELRPGHQVTITRGGRSGTYGLLRSLKEIRGFAFCLKCAKANDIAIDGVCGSDHMVEKAIAAAFSNAVANLPDDHTKPPFLVMTLWEIGNWLQSDLSAVMYCLDRIREIAPTSFEVAKLLVLSQCDSECPDEFVPLPTADQDLICNAIRMLTKQRNGKVREARGLLRRLSASGQYESVLTSLYFGFGSGYD
jgi:hypothetical protein